MTDEIMRQGVRRLRAWLPAARAELARGDWKWREASPIAKGMRPHISEDKLRAVCIYPAPKGGWHADVVFKDMPPGVPDVVGTPVGSPKATREETLKTGRDILKVVLATARQNAAQPPDTVPPPVFMLHGWAFPLQPDVLAHYAALAPNQRDGTSRAVALALMEDVLSHLCPDGFDGQAFNAWPPQQKSGLMAALHAAALAGVTRYPPLEDASPSGHKESSEAVH